MRAIAILAVALLVGVGAVAAAAPASADPGSDGNDGNQWSPECSPGQHGNPQPGFKPGSCSK